MMPAGIALPAGLTAANNLSDVADAPTSRTNLGLGTAAVAADSDFNKTANNLSDVADAQTARENLEVDPHFGSMYVSATAGTAVGTPGTFVKAAGTWTPGPIGPVGEMDMPVNGRLRHVGTETRTYRVSCSITSSTSDINRTTRWRLVKTGAEVAESEQKRKHGNNDIGNTGIEWLVTLGQNDWIELWVSTVSSSTTVTVENAQVVLYGAGA